MNIILFDNQDRTYLFPLTLTRPAGELRIGILTIKEKWEKRLSAKASFLTQSHLAAKFPLCLEKENVLISGSVCPNKKLADAVLQLKTGQTLVRENEIIAHRVNDIPQDVSSYCGEKIEFKETFTSIHQLWDIFAKNEEEIRSDFELLTKGSKSQEISDTNIVIGDRNNIFLEEGAVVEASVLNAKNGYIYIDKNAEIMEGCLIRGSLALCENAQLKMGTKIYGATTIGPCSKIGGEVSNVVVLGFSNKAHDGFMGNSVIGEWCNLGAGTNTSNLKNDYGDVRLWNYADRQYKRTGLQFCGLIMGDYSKCGINTMFNTGTLIGVATNLFGEGYMPNFVDSFKWGGKNNLQDYRIESVFETAQKVYARRGKEFNDNEKNILKYIYEQDKQ